MPHAEPCQNPGFTPGSMQFVSSFFDGELFVKTLKHHSCLGSKAYSETLICLGHCSSVFVNSFVNVQCPRPGTDPHSFSRSSKGFCLEQNWVIKLYSDSLASKWNMVSWRYCYPLHTWDLFHDGPHVHVMQSERSNSLRRMRGSEHVRCAKQPIKMCRRHATSQEPKVRHRTPGPMTLSLKGFRLDGLA